MKTHPVIVCTTCAASQKDQKSENNENIDHDAKFP